MRAVFDADARRINVANDRTVLLDVHAAAGVDVADNFAVGHDVTGVNFGIELSCRTDREFMAFQRNRAIDDAIDLQVFRAMHLSPDLNAGAEARGTVGRGTTKTRGQRLIWRSDWSCYRR